VLSHELEATPAQEKVIADALREMQGAIEKHRGEFRESRGDVAKAVRSEHFDEVLFGELFSRHDTAIEAVRKAAMGALGKVHAVLEPKQRERLAEMIEGGLFRGLRGFRGHGGGGYRGPGAWV
jgi:Spy/CpxP family protein refolding chaperone